MIIVPDKSFFDIEKYPYSFVFPILFVRDGRSSFSGNCFFAGKSLITAKHVLQQYSPFRDGDCFHIISANPAVNQPKVFQFKLIDDLDSTGVDCVRIEFDNMPIPKEPQLILSSDLSLNYFDDIICFEHSPTIVESRAGQTKQSVYLNPYHFKGNILRKNTDSNVVNYEVSFQALKGASGAPVINKLSREVIGIITTNARATLQPIHRVTDYDDDKVVSQEEYILPHGILLSSEDILKRWGAILVRGTAL